MQIYKDHCVHAIVLQVGEFRVGTSKHDIKQQEVHYEQLTNLNLNIDMNSLKYGLV